MSRIAACFAQLRQQGRTALVPYVTAGDPEPVETVPLMHAMVAAGADIIELGVPFSDPMADGMTIQRSSFVAIENGVTLSWIFDQLESAGGFDAPLVMMSYLNPLLAYGYDELARRAAATGVCGFIVPDLPLEESGELLAALAATLPESSRVVGVLDYVTLCAALMAVVLLFTAGNQLIRNAAAIKTWRRVGKPHD